MKVAIEGCCHGELDAIYKQLDTLQQKHSYEVDLLLICGDFQAIRNHQDLQCMAVPQKYRQLGGFHKYYTGQKIAPVLTIVIGGNHEASNYLWELYHGGWLAPNIYYLGHAGCVQVNGIRIAGASGIFKSQDFRQGHWEKVPYDHQAMRSIYHIRDYDVHKLSLLSPPEIFLSHDWPQSIEQHGNVAELLRRKPFFRQDINSGKLGSPPLMGLLRTLKPKWWFSAHLHVRFEASVDHNGDQQPPSVQPQVINPDEITIDDDEFGDVPAHEPESQKTEPFPKTDDPPYVAVSSNPEEIHLELDVVAVHELAPSPTKPRKTKFLALDKCLPNRQYMEVVDIDIPKHFNPNPSPFTQSRASPVLTYDLEWLAITRAFHLYLSTTRQQTRLPDEAQARLLVREHLEWVNKNVGTKQVADCQVFWPTAPGPGSEGPAMFEQPPWYTNPQTLAFCSMLQLENKVNPVPPGMPPPPSHESANQGCINSSADTKHGKETCNTDEDTVGTNEVTQDTTEAMEGAQNHDTEVATDGMDNTTQETDGA